MTIPVVSGTYAWGSAPYSFYPDILAQTEAFFLYSRYKGAMLMAQTIAPVTLTSRPKPTLMGSRPVDRSLISVPRETLLGPPRVTLVGRKP